MELIFCFRFVEYPYNYVDVGFWKPYIWILEIILSTKIEDFFLKITVSNTGKLEISENTTKLGIKNIEERLNLLYGKEAAFSLNEKDNLRNEHYVTEFYKNQFKIKTIPRIEMHNELIVIEKLN